MKDCIFCKIVKGEIPSVKIWEDSRYIAILDIHPNIAGQTLVISKRHLSSYAFALTDIQLGKFMKVTKKVVLLLEQKLGVKRVNLVLEGTFNDHLHAKLYPAIGYPEGKNAETENLVKFDQYPGYVTTLLGPQADTEELKSLQQKITG